METTTTTPAPEVTSDAETLPLPGLPGAVESENVPSPVEEETERTMNDPYVNVPEGITAIESAPPETAPSAAAGQEHIGLSSSGAGGSGVDIPSPEIPAVSGTGTESVHKPSEAVSKEAQEAVSSESANPSVELRD